MAAASRTRTIDTQLFRDVFNASPIGIAVESLEGEPLFINPAFYSMLGFSEEELRGKHCVEFSPPEDAEKDLALFQQLRARSIDHYQLEKHYFRQDGSLARGRLSIFLFPRQRRTAAVGAAGGSHRNFRTECSDGSSNLDARNRVNVRFAAGRLWANTNRFLKPDSSRRSSKSYGTGLAVTFSGP
jgi:PAS domain S-box-containing protein